MEMDQDPCPSQAPQGEGFLQRKGDEDDANQSWATQRVDTKLRRTVGTDVRASNLGEMKVTFSDSHEGMLGLAGSGENPHLSKASGEQGLIGWNREWELMARGGRGFCLLGHVSPQRTQTYGPCKWAQPPSSVPK